MDVLSVRFRVVLGGAIAQIVVAVIKESVSEATAAVGVAVETSRVPVAVKIANVAIAVAVAGIVVAVAIAGIVVAVAVTGIVVAVAIAGIAVAVPFRPGGCAGCHQGQDGSCDYDVLHQTSPAVSTKRRMTCLGLWRSTISVSERPTGR